MTSIYLLTNTTKVDARFKALATSGDGAASAEEQAIYDASGASKATTATQVTSADTRSVDKASASTASTTSGAQIARTVPELLRAHGTDSTSTSTSNANGQSVSASRISVRA